MGIERESVQRWRAIVESELNRAGVPLPVDLILSIIHTESRGYAGATNQDGGASGLMQIMPGTLASYNKQNPSSPVTLEELRSKDDSSARKQIRVGIWVISSYWKSAYKYLSSRLADVPIDELAHIADLFYRAGPGGTQKKLDQLPIPSWSAVQAAFPDWAPLKHPRNVFGQLDELEWPVDKINVWLGKLQKAGILPEVSPKDGLFLSMIAILAAWYWLKKKD